MTLLSDRDILRAIQVGQIDIDPWDRALLQPASLDVRLSNLVRLFDGDFVVGSRYAAVDPKIPEPTTLVEVPEGEPFTLGPGQFVLGCTMERVSLDDSLACRLEGKSSLGRLGLLTHATAGFIDPGFSGQITLELHNLLTRPLTLWPGMKIGQLCFLDLSSRSAVPYGAAGNHYQGQLGPTPSRAFAQFVATVT